MNFAAAWRINPIEYRICQPPHIPVISVELSELIEEASDMPLPFHWLFTREFWDSYAYSEKRMDELFSWFSKRGVPDADLRRFFKERCDIELKTDKGSVVLDEQTRKLFIAKFRQVKVQSELFLYSGLPYEKFRALGRPSATLEPANEVKPETIVASTEDLLRQLLVESKKQTRHMSSIRLLIAFAWLTVLLGGLRVVFR